jgi:hypothetical protein
VIKSVEKSNQAIYDKILSYRSDGKGFLIDILGMREDYIWDKMVEMLDAVSNNQKIAIKAGHSVSKTYSMGRIVTWLKTCFQPSTIITTAPSDNQVRNQLWREIHASYAGARIPLGGNMTTLQWDLKPKKAMLESLDPEEREKWEKNFAIGFSTSPDSATEHATKMQGWHNDWVFVIVDEACGIMPQIWRTIMESLIVDDHCKIIAIGNPTDPESDFARACYSSEKSNMESDEAYVSDEGFYVITIDSMKNPNYVQNKRVIPGLASRTFVDSIIKKYGIDGDGTRYRVRGLFPTYKEGTYWGSLLAKARSEGRIKPVGIDRMTRVFSITDTGDMYTASIMFQVIGGKIKIVDEYWDYEGKGIRELVKWWDSHKDALWADHFVGPELAGNVKSFQTGKSILEIANELGYTLIPVVRQSFDDGVEDVRNIWPILEVNDKCHIFLKCSSAYGKKKNQALSSDAEVTYHNSPALTWHRHMMDALRYLACAYRYMIVINGKHVGYPNCVDKNDNDGYIMDYEPLSVI